MDLWITFWMVLNSLFWCSNGLSFGQREPLQGSSSFILVTYFFFFFGGGGNTSFSGSSCAYPAPALESTMFSFSGSGIRNQDLVYLWYTWGALIFSLKVCFGHRPSGFTTQKFEKYCSRVTHSRVTGISLGQAGEGAAAVKVQLQETSGRSLG